jgi:cold shock CspA family protein
VKGIARDSNGSEKWLSGSVKKIEEQYCYVTCPDLRCDVFVHASDVVDAGWDDLSVGSNVRFLLGFSFRGPRAKDVRATIT